MNFFTRFVKENSSVLADFHVHTNFSPDAKGDPEKYCQIANQNELVIGFADHWDILDDTTLSNETKLASYLETRDQLKKTYKRNIFFGLEIDFVEERIEDIQSFMVDYRKEIDFYLGSVHYVYGKSVTEEKSMRWLLSRYSFSEILTKYYSIYRSCVKVTSFDGIAHPDIVFRFVNKLVPYSSQFKKDKSIFSSSRMALQGGCAVEWNIKGLINPVGRTFPIFSQIRRLIQTTNGTIFLGSDSHSVQEFCDQLPMLRNSHEKLQILRENKNNTENDLFG